MNFQKVSVGVPTFMLFHEISFLIDKPILLQLQHGENSADKSNYFKNYHFENNFLRAIKMLFQKDMLPPFI